MFSDADREYLKALVITSLRLMQEYVKEQGYEEDFSDSRLHHEIYLSDPRRAAPEKLRTVVRHPVK